jgi:hypothetical protein
VNVRRARPLAEPERSAALELRRAEASIALLDRVRPLNLLGEQQRLVTALGSGQPAMPAFVYGPRPNLSQARRDLERLQRVLENGDVEARLLTARAEELALEAELAEQVGNERFAELAARRFPLPEDAQRARESAERLLTGPMLDAPPSPDDEHQSDDRADPRSLWSELSRLISAQRLPVRIEAVPGLASLAAVADGVVRYRPGARLSARAARRIALHEIEGHVRPRLVAQALGGVFLAGSARASEDEEGRAIWLEERAGLLDGGRRRELGRRYLAAESVRRGDDFAATVQQLGLTGATIEDAVALASRVHRGGGLGRELIYALGHARVAVAFATRPELERVLASGRVSVLAAELLLAGSVELDDHGDVI